VSKAGTEPQKGISTGEERICMIDRVAREIALHIWPGIEPERSFVKQLRFIDVDRDSGDAVIAVNRVLIEMEIVERVALV